MIGISITLDSLISLLHYCFIDYHCYWYFIIIIADYRTTIITYYIFIIIDIDIIDTLLIFHWLGWLATLHYRWLLIIFRWNIIEDYAIISFIRHWLRRPLFHFIIIFHYWHYQLHIISWYIIFTQTLIAIGQRLSHTLAIDTHIELRQGHIATLPRCVSQPPHGIPATVIISWVSTYSQLRYATATLRH